MIVVTCSGMGVSLGCCGFFPRMSDRAGRQSVTGLPHDATVTGESAAAWKPDLPGIP